MQNKTIDDAENANPTVLLSTNFYCIFATRQESTATVIYLALQFLIQHSNLSCSNATTAMAKFNVQYIFLYERIRLLCKMQIGCIREEIEENTENWRRGETCYFRILHGNSLRMQTFVMLKRCHQLEKFKFITLNPGHFAISTICQHFSAISPSTG